MGKRKILIKIRPDGHTEYEIEGMPGNTCETITEALLRCDDMHKEEEKLTSETFIQDTRPDYLYSQGN